jgi:DNA repair exonuclease SbcCD ATPase subunit
MKALPTVIAVLVLVGAGGRAEAQPGGAGCDAMKAAAKAAKDRAAAIDGELSTLDRQIADLVTRKAERTRAKETALAEARSREAAAQQACVACERLDGRVELLKRSLGPLSARARDLGNQVRAKGAEVRTLEAEVEKVSGPYESMKCADLVPGKTDQATINRCTELFSAWNGLLIRIDQLRASLADLQARYRQLLAEIQRRKGEMAQVTAEMTRACGESPKLVDLRNLDRELDDYSKFQVQVDDALNALQKMKGRKLQQPKGPPRLKQLR